MDLTVVVAFAVAVLVLSVVPGPDMMFVVANAIAGGRRAGFVAAVGMSTGLAVHTFAAAFGLAALIQAAPAVLDGVRIVGAVVLVYLAVSTWRARRQATTATTTEDIHGRRSVRKVYVMATLTNLANPKVVLFYLAFLPQFLITAPTSWPVMWQLLTLGAVFIAVGLAVDATAGCSLGLCRAGCCGVARLVAGSIAPPLGSSGVSLSGWPSTSGKP